MNCDLCFEMCFDELVKLIMMLCECFVMVKEGMLFVEVKVLMYSYCFECVLVVNDVFELCGLMIVKDIMK